MSGSCTKTFRNIISHFRNITIVCYMVLQLQMDVNGVQLKMEGATVLKVWRTTFYSANNFWPSIYIFQLQKGGIRYNITYSYYWSFKKCGGICPPPPTYYSCVALARRLLRLSQAEMSKSQNPTQDARAQMKKFDNLWQYSQWRVFAANIIRGLARSNHQWTALCVRL